ncbi:MAG: DUF2887 domain-containing protein [Deltaproteobacteria bacterium]|nr:DUF2887 domain-containing protein [Deltaproteobacteria bacterium]
MDKPGTRSTDEAFYKFVQLANDAVLKLLGIEGGHLYTVQAETLKTKNISPDIVAAPTEGLGDVVIMECQGYHDPFIRHRLAGAVSMYCDRKKYAGPILPVIFYTERCYFEAALPMKIADSTNGYTIQGRFKEIILEELQEEDLLAVDPRLVALAPFTVSKKMPIKELIGIAQHWGELVSRAYPDDVSTELFDVIALFVLSRFHDVTREEVIAMLNIDLAETRAGQDIFKMGELKDAREMLIEALEARFGWVPGDLCDKVNQIQMRASLKELHRLAIKAQNLETFETEFEKVLTRSDSQVN